MYCSSWSAQSVEPLQDSINKFNEDVTIFSHTFINFAVEWLALLPIRGIPGLNLSADTGYLQAFCGFPPPYQTDACTVPRPLPSLSLPIHCPLITPTFDATCSELQAASLNKTKDAPTKRVVPREASRARSTAVCLTPFRHAYRIKVAAASIWQFTI
jgi:hypothetical protein